MYTRYLTYDLYYADSEDYNELYEMLDNYDAKKITESTYEIKTNDDWNTFKNKIVKVTHKEDKVFAIVNNNGIELRKIR